MDVTHNHGAISKFNISDIPPGLLRKVQEEARTSIEPYCVSFVRHQKSFGSGTFVHAFGAFGILTADHVAKNLFDHHDSPIGVVITKEPAATFLRRDQIEVVEIGGPLAADSYTENGPDLAFLKILDPDLLSTIRAKKSFVPLERGLLEGYEMAFTEGLYPSPIIVAGAPEILDVHQGELGTSKHVLQTAHFTGEVEFVRMVQEKEFDLITLRTSSGKYGFPSDYGGLSGGGLWFAPFSIDPDQGFSSIKCVQGFSLDR